MSLRSRLFSSVPRSSSWALRGKGILRKAGLAVAARKYLLIMIAGAVAVAALSVKLHLHQAEKLGEARENCQTRFAEYALEREQLTQRLLREAREEAARERLRLQQERDRQAQEARALREQLDITVSALAEELDRRAAAQPEIVPWLDTPVPSSLLQD